MASTGILGIGTYIPPIVRTNEWWSAEHVTRWREQMAHRATRAEASSPAEHTSGAMATLAALAEYADDPFRGAVERRVMPDDMTCAEMEAHAAREALSRAGVAPADVDVILTQTPVPEHLMVNSACITHRLLELPPRCIALGTEAACNAFAVHATLADALIRSGRARHVLSVHSSAITRTHGPSEPHSAWWGDGAAAGVFGPVADGSGLLAAVHHADGSGCDALVLGVPGLRWWEVGAVTTYAPDRVATRAMLLTIVDRSGAALRDALTEAGLDPAAVEFYAAHQGTPWLTRVTAAHAGLGNAATVVTFPSLGNMNSVNVPFILAEGERRGLLRDGMVVATFSGGLGETWSSLVLRWGCER